MYAHRFSRIVRSVISVLLLSAITYYVIALGYMNFYDIGKFIMNPYTKSISSSDVPNQTLTKEKSKEEKSATILQYIQNVTLLNQSPYVSMLEECIEKYKLYDKININSLKNRNDYPCLIPPELRIQFNNTWEGHRLPIISTTNGGRLGNKMLTYASLFALGRLYNVTVLIHPELNKDIRRIFPFLSMKNLTESLSKLRIWKKVSYVPILHINCSPVELAASGYYGPNHILLTDYPWRLNLFNFIREDIVKEFKFSDFYVKQVNAFLSKVEKVASKKFNKTNPIYISLHIRRTDYVEHLPRIFDCVFPNETYFKSAIEYYRKKFPFSVFIAASDDRKHLKSVLQNETDVFLVPDVDGPTTMAILSSCNHSIIGPGSYGFWSGYLTGGEVVYFDLKCRKPYFFTKQAFTEAKLKSFHLL